MIEEKITNVEQYKIYAEKYIRNVSLTDMGDKICLSLESCAEKRVSINFIESLENKPELLLLVHLKEILKSAKEDVESLETYIEDLENNIEK